MMQLLVFSLLFSPSIGTPQWHNLECEPGHKYLFSEVNMTWSDAVGECGLYGGWLVDLRTREEQNCIMRGAKSAQIVEGWYWHDGKSSIVKISVLCF